MKFAYIDTSYLIAIVFNERNSSRLRLKLLKFDRIFSSNLLEAEFLSTLKRESIGNEIAREILEPISWVFPNRTLTEEFNQILPIVYLKGTDLWHLSCALYLGSPQNFTFLTLDLKQKQAAKKLGFKI
jgi:predicted nucleic acid-binding protein